MRKLAGFLLKQSLFFWAFLGVAEAADLPRPITDADFMPLDPAEVALGLALLLALVELPDYATPFNSIARSLEKLSGREGKDTDDMVSDDLPWDATSGRRGEVKGG